MASLTNKNTCEDITLLPLDEFEVSRLTIFNNKYLYLYILQFIFLDARTIGRFQLTSHANKYWNHVVLKGFKWDWRWKKIEAMLGKDKTEQLKNTSLETNNRPCI